MSVKFVETPAAYFGGGAYVDLPSSTPLLNSNDWAFSFFIDYEGLTSGVNDIVRFSENNNRILYGSSLVGARIGTSNTYYNIAHLGSIYNGFLSFEISKNGTTITTIVKNIGGTEVSNESIIVNDLTDLTFEQFANDINPHPMKSFYNVQASIDSHIIHHWPLVNNNFTDRITGITGTPIGVTSVLQDNYHNVENGLIPDKFGGKLEIDGAKYTISELQNSTYGDTIFSSFHYPKSPKILTFNPPATAKQKERIQYEL